MAVSKQVQYFGLLGILRWRWLLFSDDEHEGSVTGSRAISCQRTRAAACSEHLRAPAGETSSGECRPHQGKILTSSVRSGAVLPTA